MTIRTVAEHAGVSVAAVSKVLRDAYGVSAALRAKVEASIATLNYRPSAAARGMRGQTYTIGVIMADINNPFYPQIFEGINDGLSDTQYIPLIGLGRGLATIETTIVHAMVDRQMDGIIMIGQRLNTPGLNEVAKSLPIVVVAHHEPTATAFDTVNNDDELGGRLVVEHLLAQGYKRPAMITLSRAQLGRVDVSDRRERGFAKAMQAAGLGHYVHIEAAEAELDDVTATVRELLERPDPPDAIFGWADYYALEVLSAVRTLGYRVPEDIGVIGYDNSEPCSFTQNNLTSIDQSGREIGRQAVRMLLERIGGRTTVEHFVTTPKVSLRGSTQR
ncbi:LacI family DNA-binding transcriptional regulator [Devosia ginsengisoli]|uniref:LacI family DNA-binding transcriptional regulator n=1 Tax=Devosia ginsengisoli TaxID=400770 RepID=UPI001647F128|nr:LacI family DNA-binding transcriptional regulator [Devosia ginsengisoli]